MAVLDDQRRRCATRSRTCATATSWTSSRQAARSRSEADWIVGMNATRAATIRLRSSFDGAVSLGRVQTPTLAILARREEEIRAFVPETYWLVDADVRRRRATRSYEGRFHAGAKPRLATEEEAAAIVEAVRGGAARSPSSTRRERTERAPLLYDLTSLQREANTRFGFSARRTLARRAALLRGAQGAHLSAYQLALPDRATWSPRSSRSPRTSARRAEYAKAAAYVTGARPAAARPRRRRREGRRPPRDHPDERRAQPRRR